MAPPRRTDYRYSNTVLRRFNNRCGDTIYLPSHNYHMPQADIRLESPHYVIRAMGGISHDVVNGWNIKWHLPGGRIIDIPIDLHTNLPLIRDFFAPLLKRRNLESSTSTVPGYANHVMIKSLITWISTSVRKLYTVARQQHIRRIKISAVLRRSYYIGIRGCASTCKTSSN